MIFRVGIEYNNEGYRSIAWVLEHPGCYAYGKDGDSALEALSAALQAYIDWIAKHKSKSWLVVDKIEFRIEDTWTDYGINEAFDRDEKSDFYMVDAWFQHDWKPLTAADIERGLKLLSWSREDVLATVAGLGQEKLDRTYPNERWSIAGILKHIGGAECWYLDRLGLSLPREQIPGEPFDRLKVSRARLNEMLPTLEGMKQVFGVDGEFWSPRKVLRRALWHEKDHVEHICKLIAI
jgi:predicted RNase H-like HicB family nuclease